MKTFMIFTFLTTLVKSGLIVSLGILIKNHFETLISLFVRKPIPDNLIEEQKYEKVAKIMKWIGIFIILSGIGLAIMALASLNMGLKMPTNNFNFKF